MPRLLLSVMLFAICATGVLLGGASAWAGFVAVILIFPIVDHLGGQRDLTPGHAGVSTLSLFLSVPMFIAMLCLNLWMLGGTSRQPGDFLLIGRATQSIAGYDLFRVREQMGWASYAGMLLSFSVTMGLICMSRAHELVHRISSPSAVFLGNALYGFGFDGSYAIEHVYGHHADVCTPDDPVTARRGETAGQFFIRSTTGQYRNAWAREKARLAGWGRSPWSPGNKVLVGHGFTIAFLALGFAACGAIGGLLNLALMLHVKWNAEVSNYVQHYGLVRVPGSPIEPRHSWDCRHRMSSVATVNLTRHADHHVRSSRPFWDLVASHDAPRMPYGFVLTQIVAGQPWLWKRIMEPRLVIWDQMLASNEERAIISALEAPRAASASN